MSDADRAARAYEDVVAVERMAPGMVRVVTWADVYVVDARDAGCNCPDKQYNLDGEGPCKHELAALAADVDRLPSPGLQVDDLDARTATDGGTDASDSDADAYDRHDIELRDVADADDPRCPDGMHGCLVVSYNTVKRPNGTFVEGRHISTRLPTEALVLFDGGTVDVADLPAWAREWLATDSALWSNEIDFAGTDTGPEVDT